MTETVIQKFLNDVNNYKFPINFKTDMFIKIWDEMNSKKNASQIVVSLLCSACGVPFSKADIYLNPIDPKKKPPDPMKVDSMYLAV